MFMTQIVTDSFRPSRTHSYWPTDDNEAMEPQEEKKTVFARQLRKAAIAIGWPTTQEGLGKKLGVSGTMARAYLQGEKLPGMERALDMCSRLNVNLNWLMMDAGPMRPSDLGDYEGIVPARAAEYPQSNAEVLTVPVMDASPSMGTGVYAPDNDAVVDFMRLSMMWVRRNLAISRPDALRIVIGLGDSMLPTFANGDLLLVDTGIHELKVDAIYCMAREDELFIKRVQRRMDGGFNIISDNDKYQPFVISSPEAEQLRILGRVVWAWNGRSL